uniref:Secreted protein n=1 Tax=Setaria viridis TaxID=4556 RepID=A0A4U6W6I0_SETVI|nr:hypothetical protein SEVIR_2G212620v2 [Setaria viridis]
MCNCALWLVYLFPTCNSRLYVLLTLAWNLQHLTSVDYNLYLTSVSVCKDSSKLQPNLHSLMGNEQDCVSSSFCWTEETLQWYF